MKFVRRYFANLFALMVVIGIFFACGVGMISACIWLIQTFGPWSAAAVVFIGILCLVTWRITVDETSQFE